MVDKHIIVGEHRSVFVSYILKKLCCSSILGTGCPVMNNTALAYFFSHFSSASSVNLTVSSQTLYGFQSVPCAFHICPPSSIPFFPVSLEAPSLLIQDSLQGSSWQAVGFFPP